MNISKETIKKLEELGYVVFGMSGYKSTDEGLSFNDAEYLVVSLSNDESFYIKSLKTPKVKEVTVDWVLSKIERESSYKNLSQYLRKIFGYSISVYPASYGIGIDTLGEYKRTAKTVSDKLNELGLKFRNEFSNAAWVYRFVISRDKDNMRILESLK